MNRRRFLQFAVVPFLSKVIPSPSQPKKVLNINPISEMQKKFFESEEPLMFMGGYGNGKSWYGLQYHQDQDTSGQWLGISRT